MPFSFKPEISQTLQDKQSPSSPQAAFGGSPAQNLMSREGLHGKSIIGFILICLFGVTALLTAGLVGYKFYLTSQIEGKKATLSSYESQLANLPLEDMRKLSNRIKIINQLVKEHPSANVAFKIVEDSVENQITYTNFSLQIADKAYALSLTGTAPTYAAIAQQVDTFKRKPYTTYVSGISVDGLQLDDKGRIGFSLKMPITIAGLLPEDLNLSEGAADRVASSTNAEVMPTVTGTTTPEGFALPPQ